MERIERFREEAHICMESEVVVSSHYMFSDFVLLHQDNIVVFKWMSFDTSGIYNLTYIASEDYPDNGYLTWNCERTGTEDNLVSSVPLFDLIKSIGEELLAKDQEKMNTEDQPEGGKDAEDVIVQTENPETAQNVEVSTPDLAQAASAERMDSNDSDNSEYVDCEEDSDSEDDDVDNYDFDPLDLYGYDNDPHRAVDEMDSSLLRCVHPILRHDIQMFRDLLEPSQEMKSRMADKTAFPMLTFRILDSLQELDCDIHVPLNNLSLPRQLARAWQLDLNKPLVLRINLSSGCYLDFPDVPTVDVLQPSTKECPVAKQVKNMVQIFVKEIWDKFDNDFVRGHLKKSESVPSCLSSTTRTTEEKKRSFLKRMKSFFGSSEGGSKRRQEQDRQVKHLMEMGFGEDQARDALCQVKYNLVEASLLLYEKASSAETADENKSQEEELSSCQRRAPKLSKRCLSSPIKTRNMKKSEAVSRSMSTSHTDPDMTEGSENPMKMKSRSYLEAKMIPPLDYGFLVMLYKYVRQRVPTLNEFCVICDKPHAFQTGGPMLMPSVCSRELCLFSFQTLGVMADSVTDIATGAEVVDLLITMAKEACLSTRQAIIFDPYPNIVDPDQSEHAKLALSDKAKDYKKVEKLLQMIPPMHSLVASSFSNLQTTLDEQDKLLYPLLSWIIYSNRSHIVKLTKDKQLKMMTTPHQFLLLSSPPAQEKAFQMAKAQFGSTFAFHGSGIENWHSIIRKGLIVASGSKYQINGAAHGAGIYLSPLASFSSGYSGMGYGTHRLSRKSRVFTRPRFLTGQKKSCMALCEVINSPSLKKSSDSIWVCSNEDHVCTRFFFVYEDGQVNQDEVNMCDKQHRRTVEEALDKCFMAVVPDLHETEKSAHSHQM